MNEKIRRTVSKRVDRVVADQILLKGLFAITVTLIILYFIIRQTAYYSELKAWLGQSLEWLWAAIIGAANFVFSVIKDFREKILFKNNKPRITVNEGPKVLLWIMDGISVPAFLDVVGKNSHLRTLYDEGYFAQCVTIFPSITPAAHSSLLTGCYPAKTGIPAFDWVEVETEFSGRETREYVRCMPDYKRFIEERWSSKARKQFFDGLGDALYINQRYLNPIAYTVFESLGEDWYTMSVKEWIHRGADNFIRASVSEALDSMFRKKISDKPTMVSLLEAVYKEVQYEFGGALWGSTSEQRLADLMVYWKTGTDTKSHEFGPGSTEVRDEIDEAARKLAETLCFYKMHTNQELYVIITADHSQSRVTRYSDLIEDLKEALGARYKVAVREDHADEALINEADVIITNNDRSAFFYVFGESQARKEAKEMILELLVGREEVDLILYRQDGRIQAMRVTEAGPEGPEEIADFFEDKDEEYPYAVERIEGLMGGEKWGDVVISLKEGYSVNPDFKPDREDTEVLHGDHGGLNYSDSVVPLLVWGPSIKSNPKDGGWETFRTVDITSTITSIFDVAPRRTDGRVLKEIFI